MVPFSEALLSNKHGDRQGDEAEKGARHEAIVTRCEARTVVPVAFVLISRKHIITYTQGLINDEGNRKSADPTRSGTVVVAQTNHKGHDQHSTDKEKGATIVDNVGRRPKGAIATLR